MAIISQGPNPASRATSWADALSPLAQAAGSYAKEHRQKQQNISQGSFLEDLIKNIEQKGEGATLADVIAARARAQQAGLSPEYGQRIEDQYQKEFAQKAAQEAKAAPAKAKMAEKERAAVKSLDILNKQRERLKSGHLGPVAGLPSQTREWGSTFSEEGIKTRGEYEQAGKGLIQAASPIVIRNRAEFDTLAHDLYNPKLPKSKIEGILNALEDIIRMNIEDLEGFEYPKKAAESTPEKEELGLSQQAAPLKFKPGTTHLRVRHKKHGEAKVPVGEFRPHPDVEIVEEMANQ